MHKLHDTTEVPIVKFVDWLGIARAKFYEWRRRYGKANEHNAKIPRDHWTELWERQAIIDYFDQHPLEGYRRLTFMMLDDDIVAVSPATTYRVLRAAGRLDRHRPKPSTKGTGFVQPLGPHRHSHRPLQQPPFAQRHRLRHPARQTPRPRDRDLGRPRPQARGSPRPPPQEPRTGDPAVDPPPPDEMKPLRARNHRESGEVHGHQRMRMRHGVNVDRQRERCGRFYILAP